MWNWLRKWSPWRTSNQVEAKVYFRRDVPGTPLDETDITMVFTGKHYAAIAVKMGGYIKRHFFNRNDILNRQIRRRLTVTGDYVYIQGEDPLEYRKLSIYAD